MIVYSGPLDDSRALIQFFRSEVDKFKALRRLVVSAEKTIVEDVNGDCIEFPGLTFGNRILERLLRELGIVFPATILHDPKSTLTGIREFDLSACWTWGHG